MKRIDNLISKIRSFFYLQGGYDDVRYWRKRGKNYKHEFDKISPDLLSEFHFQEEKILGILHTVSFSSVLELGCGFGRVLKLIGDNFPGIELRGYDISPDQIEKACELLGPYRDRVHLDVGNIRDIDLQEIGNVELVYTSEVLMHIREVEEIIDKILSIPHLKYIMHIEWSEKDVHSESSWVFNHDLEKIYSSRGFASIRIEEVVRGQKIFLINKNEG